MGLVRDRLAMRARRAGLISAGLCTGCGAVPPRPGRRQCQACASKAVARARRRFARRKAPLEKLGVCIRCAVREAVPGTKTCGACSEKWVEYKGTLRARYRAEGLCLWCGGGRDRTDRTLCAACRQKAAANHRNHTRTFREAG